LSVFIQALGDLEQDPAVASIYVEKLMSGVVRVELHAGSEVLKSWPSFKQKRKKVYPSCLNSILSLARSEFDAGCHEAQIQNNRKKL
jgi:hypothetical protein